MMLKHLHVNLPHVMQIGIEVMVTQIGIEATA
jgi:hypothetical protein